MPPETRRNPYLRWIIAVLAVLLVVLGIVFVVEIHDLRHAALVNARITWFARHHFAPPLTAADVGFIQPWMTFDYVNRTFALPAAYLQGRLGFSAGNYPRVTISSAASADHASSTVFLNDVRSAVAQYLTPSSTPPAGSTTVQ